MTTQPLDQHGHALRADMLSGRHAWRQQHPKATLREMEREVDARLTRLRARMLEDMALQRAAADRAQAHAPAQPLGLSSATCMNWRTNANA